MLFLMTDGDLKLSQATVKSLEPDRLSGNHGNNARTFIISGKEDGSFFRLKKYGLLVITLPSLKNFWCRNIPKNYDFYITGTNLFLLKQIYLGYTRR